MLGQIKENNFEENDPKHRFYSINIIQLLLLILVVVVVIWFVSCASLFNNIFILLLTFRFNS